MVQNQNNRKRCMVRGFTRSLIPSTLFPLPSTFLGFLYYCVLISKSVCTYTYRIVPLSYISGGILHALLYTLGFFLLSSSEGFKTILFLRYLSSASSYRQYAGFRGTCREAQTQESLASGTWQLSRLRAQVNLKCGVHVTWCCLGCFRLPYKAHSAC